jgi:hypothetical protein
MEELLTIRQAAERSGHTVAGLKMRIRRGKLVAHKGNDGALRVKAEDVSGLPPPEKDERQDRPEVILGRIVDQLRGDLAAANEQASLAREAAAREAALRQAAELRVAQLDMVLAEARRPFFVRFFSGMKKNHP